MTRIDRLQPAAVHAGKKERAALLEVARAQGLLDFEREQLARLRRHKLEYLERGGTPGLVSPVAMQDYYRFLELLDRTILGQVEMVARRERELEHQRRLWRASRLDSKKVHRVIENLQREATVEERRRDQKLQDEFAGRSRNRG